MLLGGLLAVGGCSADEASDGSGSRVAGSVEETDELSGVELERPIPRPSFTLTDVSDGEPFHFREETEGTLTLLFIGYTHCPDVCPVHMANLAAVLPELPSEVQERIRVVFVSSDPARDTPARIREWLSSFDPSFIGLRGSRAEVNALEKSLGLPPSVVEETSNPPPGGGDVGEEAPPGEGPGDGAVVDTEDYFVGHAAQVLVFEADDTARVAYPWGTRQRDWLRDLPRLATEEET